MITIERERGSETKGVCERVVTIERERVVMTEREGDKGSV